MKEQDNMILFSSLAQKGNMLYVPVGKCFLFVSTTFQPLTHGSSSATCIEVLSTTAVSFIGV